MYLLVELAANFKNTGTVIQKYLILQLYNKRKACKQVSKTLNQPYIHPRNVQNNGQQSLRFKIYRAKNTAGWFLYL